MQREREGHPDDRPQAVPTHTIPFPVGKQRSQRVVPMGPNHGQRLESFVLCGVSIHAHSHSLSTKEVSSLQELAMALPCRLGEPSSWTARASS